MNRHLPLLVVAVTVLVVTGSVPTAALVAGGSTSTASTTDTGLPLTVQDNETATATETATPTGTETATPNGTESGTPTATETATPNGTENETTDGTENETTDSTENETADGNESVNVTVGRQLATVLTVTDEEVQGEVQNASLTAAFQQANETERAQLLAARAGTVTEQAELLVEEYQLLVQAAENETISKSEFANRLALLNARANQLESSLRRVTQLAGQVSDLELQAAGYSQGAVNDTRESLGVVTGPGSSALLAGFTNGNAGNATVSTNNGVSVSVQRGPESSREIERAGDDSQNITINQSTALATARGALSQVNGTWQLSESSVDSEDGVYTFEFRLSGNTSGEAEVTVDGSSGTVVKLEEEIGDRGPPEDTPGEGPPEDTPGEGPPDDRGDEGELTLLIADGTPQPNATLTLAVRDDGEAVANATVRVDGETVGTTDAAGQITVQLPASGDVEIEATAGEREAELELELGGERDSDRVQRNLTATGTVENGTVTITVTFDGEPVAGVRGSVDGESVGRTGPDGTLSFQADNGTVEVEITKGQFEATLTFEIENGTVTTTGTEVDDKPGEGEGPPDEGEGPPGEGEGPPGEGEEGEEGEGEEGEEGEGEESEEGEGEEGEGPLGEGEGPPGEGEDECENEEGEGPPGEGEGPPDEGEGPPDEDTPADDDEDECDGEEEDGEDEETPDGDETETDGYRIEG